MSRRYGRARFVLVTVAALSMVVSAGCSGGDEDTGGNTTLTFVNAQDPGTFDTR